MRELRSPTAMALVIGRTQTNGRPDYENVHRFQDKAMRQQRALTALIGLGANLTADAVYPPH